ncbi:MAG: YciI family protein [Anaerolineales bacterium]|nr:YciI family protein [Anaerolineales bacterium]
MPEYIYLIHPMRHGFFEAPTPQEEAVMEEHYQYLKLAAETGAVLLAGACLDETFGLVVFRAEDEVAAQAFMFNDPSVKANVMMAELHPFRASLMGHWPLITDN